MADSANILSILQMLGQGSSPPPGADAPDVQLPGVADQPPPNVLQQAAAPPQAPPQAPQPSTTDIYQAATAASPTPPKPRRSLLDTIGKISDVLAKVGGADPLYQSSLDAATKRLTDAQDHALSVDKTTIGNATDKFKLGDMHNKRLAQAARGLQAIQAAGGDINQAWPVLAQRMGFDAATTESVGHDLATNPKALEGYTALDADSGDLKSKYSGNVIYAKDEKGNLHVFQANQSDGSARDVLPEGMTPVDPVQFVNLGDKTVGVGKQSGKPQIILPNTEKPGYSGGQPIKEAPGYSGGRPIAPPQAPVKADAAKGSDPAAGLKIIADIQQSFDNLHGMKALPGDTTNPIGAVEGAISRTRLGQAIGATTGLSAAAQERELLAKNLATLQSDLIKSLPGNATRTRFEQEIQKKRLPDPTTMTYATASRAIGQIRDAYATALREQQKAAAPTNSNLPRLSPADAAKLKPGTPFLGLDGVQRVRQ